ncbi:hypothetical protein GCM10023317_64680 [Actinopolymorpha pittospori]
MRAETQAPFSEEHSMTAARKIVAGLFMSLDGVAEAPETWNLPYMDEEMGAAVGQMHAEADTLLLGRVT